MSVLNSKLIVSLLDRVTGPAKGVSAAIERMTAASQRNTERLNAMRGQMMDAVGAGWALYRGLSAPINAAIDFESAMADVRKVVDFPTPKAFQQMGKDIRRLSTEIPMTAEGIAAIVAAAGQSNIPVDELLPFAEMAAKVGVAWEVSADSAGDSLAKLKAALGLNITDTGLLADAINHLGNNSAANAPAILNMVNRVGAQAKDFGLTAEQAAAFGAAMIGAGAEAEVAATSFRNMGRALTRGASATARQQAAYRQLGLTSRNVAKDMQKDAVGTIQMVLARIRKVPDHMRAALVSDLFGDEARALGPLITNSELLAETLALVADRTEYAGSANEEYLQRSKTTANALQLLRQRTTDLTISVGDALLPAINSIVEKVGPVITSISDLAQRFPRVTQAIVGVTAALIGFRVATTAFGFAGLFMKGALLDMGIAALTAGRALGRATFSAAARAVTTLLNPVKLVTVAFRALRIAVIGTGVGAALVALAAAGTWIYNNWTGITLAFEAFRGAFSRAIEPIRSALAPAIDGFATLSGWVSGLLGPVDEMGGSWTAAGMAIGNFAGQALVSLVELPRKVMDAWSTMSWSEMGQSAARSLVDGFAAARDWIGNIFSSIDLGGYWQAGIEQTRTALTGIVGTVDNVVANAKSLFSGFADTISQAIGTIDFNGMMAGASTAIMGFYGTITDLLLSVDWGGLGVRFGELIRTGLSGAFDLWTTLMGGFTGAEATGIGATIAAAILSFDWAGVGGAILRYIGAALSAGAQFLRGVFRGLLGFDLLDEGARLAQSMWDGIRTKVDEIVAWFKGFPARIAALASDMVEAGAALMRGLFDGIKAVMAEIVAYIKSSITEAFASVRSGASNLLSKVTFGLAGTPSSSGGVDGARAKGGPVKAGGTYLVGEEGPEIVTFPHAGRVHDAGKSARILRNAAIASSAMALPAAAHMQDTLQMPDLPALHLAIPELPALKVEMPQMPALEAIVPALTGSLQMPDLSALRVATPQMQAMPGMPAMPIPQQSAAAPFDVAALFEQMRPPATDRKQARPVEVNFSAGAFQIEVKAQPGQSPREIAEMVERHLSAKLTGLYNGAFHDGVN